jgi:hypothetical protein
MILSRVQTVVLAIGSVLALAGFAWPFTIPASSSQSDIGAGVLAVVALAAISVAVLWTLDRGFLGPKQLAVLGGMAALASATRIATAGVAGFELVFLFVILGGFAFGPKFGFLLGALTVSLSSVFFGGFGPWTPFQIFAVGWVGLGAGLIGKLALGKRTKLILLAVYAGVSSYLFGLVMNLWFWPFAVGPESSISYRAGAPVSENLASYLIYTLTTSTLTWDTVRAVVLVVAIALVGKPVLAVLARAKL